MPSRAVRYIPLKILLTLSVYIICTTGLAVNPSLDPRELGQHGLASRTEILVSSRPSLRQHKKSLKSMSPNIHFLVNAFSSSAARVSEIDIRLFRRTGHQKKTKQAPAKHHHHHHSNQKHKHVHHPKHVKHPGGHHPIQKPTKQIGGHPGGHHPIHKPTKQIGGHPGGHHPIHKPTKQIGGHPGGHHPIQKPTKQIGGHPGGHHPINHPGGKPSGHRNQCAQVCQKKRKDCLQERKKLLGSIRDKETRNRVRKYLNKMEKCHYTCGSGKERNHLEKHMDRRTRERFGQHYRRERDAFGGHGNDHYRHEKDRHHDHDRDKDRHHRESHERGYGRMSNGGGSMSGGGSGNSGGGSSGGGGNQGGGSSGGGGDQGGGSSGGGGDQGGGSSGGGSSGGMPPIIIQQAPAPPPPRMPIVSEMIEQVSTSVVIVMEQETAASSAIVIQQTQVAIPSPAPTIPAPVPLPSHIIHTQIVPSPVLTKVPSIVPVPVTRFIPSPTNPVPPSPIGTPGFYPPKSIPVGIHHLISTNSTSSDTTNPDISNRAPSAALSPNNTIATIGNATSSVAHSNMTSSEIFIQKNSTQELS